MRVIILRQEQRCVRYFLRCAEAGEGDALCVLCFVEVYRRYQGIYCTAFSLPVVMWAERTVEFSITYL